MKPNCVQAPQAPTSAGRKGPPPSPQPCVSPMRSDRRRATLRALDLFCGAGGAGMGLHSAGFEVYGVDIAPQPRYPFTFVQGDALRPPFDLSSFDFIWASPPCQRYTTAQRLQRNDHPDLIPPIRAMLRASGVPYVIENVPGAPLIAPIELCGSMFGLRTYRHRLFECSFPMLSPSHPPHDAPTAKMGRPAKPHEFLHVVGNFSGAAAGRAAMEIDWMSRGELAEAIPPAYSEFIARAFLAQQKNNTLPGGVLADSDNQGTRHEGRYHGLPDGRSRGTSDTRANDP